MKVLKIFLMAIVFASGTLSSIVYGQTTKTVGTSGDYATLTTAFNAINAGTITGAITLQIISSISSHPSAVLYQSGYTGGGGTSNYSSVLIYPKGTFSISANVAAPLIDLNGADNVTIDGRIDMTGSSKDLTISNTSTTANSTIRFIEDATNNTVKYCTIKGSSSIGSGGIILFSTTTGTTGNDGNTIDHNDITNASDANRLRNVIYSSGSSGKANSGNIISNNNIYNFFTRTLSSGCITLYEFTTGWIISGNSFYETAEFVPSEADAAYTIIKIYYLTSAEKGSDYIISDNYIGGQSSNCSGLAWSKTNDRNNSFTAISLQVANSPACSIQNNTIQNFAWSNSGAAGWTAINVAEGGVNIGTITGNTIGAANGTGSITVIGGATASNFYGINLAGSGVIACENNTIGAITVANSNAADAANFYGIFKGNSGTCTFSDNTIGSKSQENSINATSASTDNAQIVIGIYNSAGAAPTLTIKGNTIANLTNGTTNTNTATPGLITGITSNIGVGDISNNVIHHLTIANANTTTNQTSSVSGIVLTATNAQQTVTGNTIFNLSNTYGSFAGNIIGLYFGGTGTSPINHQISGNFIHSLTVNSSSTSANVYGIKINSGNSTYSNNIISFGENTATALYGIYETGASQHNNSLYSNTIYIGGAPTSGTNLSYALYSAASTNTRNFRNNIFSNARSTKGGSNLHYAVFLNYTGNTNLTINYNDYFVSGTGGVLGGRTTTNYTNITDWRAATGQDANSVNNDPGFVNAGGTTEKDYLGSGGLGVSGTGITTDYFKAVRASTPIMGALENYNKWTGASSTVWAVDGNWSAGGVPSETSNVLIQNVSNKPELSTTVTVSNLAIETGGLLNIAYNGNLTVTNGCSNKAGTAGLVLKSTSSGTGSFINSTEDVKATVERYIAGADWATWDAGWRQLSSPIASQAIYPEFVSTFSLINEDFYKWDEPTNEWINIKTSNGTVNYSFEGSFVAGRGYLVSYDETDTKQFIGTLNYSNVEVTGLTLTGTTGVNRSWHLLGNPYASALTWDATSAWNKTNIAGVAKIWNSTGKSYTSINADGIIPSGNGFMVQVSTSTGSLTIPASKRTTPNPNWYKSSDYPVIILYAKNNDNPSFQESQVRFNPAATNGFDFEYDSDFLSGYAPLFYSVMGAENLSVNSLPGFTDETVIPFDFIKNEGTNFSIEATGIETLEPSATVFLKDNKLGIDHNLSENPVYSFTSSNGDEPARFELHFSSVGINEIQPQTVARVWLEHNTLNISNVEPGTNFEIVDLQGGVN